MDILDHSERLARQVGYAGVDQAAAEITGIEHAEELDQVERGLLVCDLQDLLAAATARSATRCDHSRELGAP